MPDQESTDSNSHSPNQESLVEVGASESHSENHTQAQNSNSQQEQSATAKLASEVKREVTLLEWIAIVGIIVNIVIASIYYGQLRQMRKATEATGVAANAAQESAKTARETFLEIQKGGTDTHELAVQAKNQADRTKDLADRAHDQAVASKHAADAATSAAGTAKETLHISERAYVTEGNVILDLDNHFIKVPISNTGHIPSGETGITIHHLIGNIANPMRPTQLTNVDCGWKRQRVQSIAVGTPYEITIPIDKADKDRVNNGTQQIIVAGFIDYNDRFSDTPI